MRSKQDILKFLEQENYNLDPITNEDAAFLIALYTGVIQPNSVSGYKPNYSLLKSEHLIKVSRSGRGDVEVMVTNITPDGDAFVEQLIPPEYHVKG